MRCRLRKVWILPAALVLSGCSDDGSAPVDPGSISEPPNDLDWRPCDIMTQAGLLVDAAECAELTVPLRRAVASSRLVTLAIKRYRRTDRPRGQLWLLAGGPGNAASDFEVDADFYASLGGDLEVYFMDHRGTGRSTRLECPDEEAPNSLSGGSIRGSEWASCSTRLLETWGEDLPGFSTTEAAADLGEAIGRTRHGSEQVFLYAVSYGTYLAERYLQLYPDQATGIILDSICAPGRCLPSCGSNVVSCELVTLHDKKD